MHFSLYSTILSFHELDVFNDATHFITFSKVKSRIKYKIILSISQTHSVCRLVFVYTHNAFSGFTHLFAAWPKTFSARFDMGYSTHLNPTPKRLAWRLTVSLFQVKCWSDINLKQRNIMYRYYWEFKKICKMSLSIRILKQKLHSPKRSKQIYGSAFS